MPQPNTHTERPMNKPALYSFGEKEREKDEENVSFFKSQNNNVSIFLNIWLQVLKFPVYQKN